LSDIPFAALRMRSFFKGGKSLPSGSLGLQSGDSTMRDALVENNADFLTTRVMRVFEKLTHICYRYVRHPTLYFGAKVVFSNLNLSEQRNSDPL
jgi:hypothetical protein